MRTVGPCFLAIGVWVIHWSLVIPSSVHDRDASDVNTGSTILERPAAIGNRAVTLRDKPVPDASRTLSQHAGSPP